jgi:hypothetical protein
LVSSLQSLLKSSKAKPSRSFSIKYF